MGKAAEPVELRGCFVVETGERQAWPFVTFCDNSGPGSRETRLYLDARWTVQGQRGVPGSPGDPIVSLLALNGLTVEQARVTGAGDLEISFAGGSRLGVSGVATAATAGEPWWFSPWGPSP
jgi:hypothetical protein